MYGKVCFSVFISNKGNIYLKQIKTQLSTSYESYQQEIRDKGKIIECCSKKYQFPQTYGFVLFYYYY